MHANLRSSLIVLVLTAAALWSVQAVALSLVQVRGPSMVPAYHDGQVLFVNRLAYGLQGPIIGEYLWLWKAPVLGEVVVVHRADEGIWVVKRVAGLAGMALTVDKRDLKIGSRTVGLSPSQAYWLAAAPSVPAGTVFVLGDNSTRSTDSRDWGFVPLRDVIGSPLF